MILHTIGYEGREIEGFLAALRTHGIETVIDVRELPLSRKAGFSKRALANRLTLNGFEYVHMPALGSPRLIRHQYRADGDWGRYKKGYLAYLSMHSSALAALAAKTAESCSALLCFEADAKCCHRRLLASAVSRLRPTAVCHIKISD